MINHIKKPIFYSAYYITFAYLFAFLIIIALQYNNYIEQISRDQFQEVSQYIRSNMAIAKHHSKNIFKRIQYIDQLNLSTKNFKYKLEQYREREAYLLGKIYTYNSKNRNISYYGNNTEKLTIKDLSFNPTILKCLEYAGTINFGQIYVNDKKDNNYSIMACYKNTKNQQVYISLINFNKLHKKAIAKYDFFKNLNILIINKYNQVIYTSPNEYIHNQNLNNTAFFKEILVNLKKNKYKNYSNTGGFNFKNYYSISTFKDTSINIFITQKSLSKSQKFYVFLEANKYIITVEFLIFFTMLIFTIKFILHPFHNVIFSMKKIISLDDRDNLLDKDAIWKLSILSIIKLFKSYYCRLKINYKIINLKYTFMEKFLDQLIDNHTENNKQLLHNFNTPLHQIKLALQSLKKDTEKSNKNDKIIIIEKALEHFELSFSNNNISLCTIDLSEAYIDIKTIINNAVDSIFNIDIHNELLVKKYFMTNNTLILADEVCLETIMYLLLISSRNLVDDLNSVTINIQTILTGIEISIKFSGKKIKKHNVEKFINCIDNRLYLNHLREYDVDILIVNYLIHLLKFDITLETSNKESIKYEMLIPNIKLKNQTL
jgi:hypothetical protein